MNTIQMVVLWLLFPIGVFSGVLITLSIQSHKKYQQFLQDKRAQEEQIDKDEATAQAARIAALKILNYLGKQIEDIIPPERGMKGVNEKIKQRLKKRKSISASRVMKIMQVYAELSFIDRTLRHHKREEKHKNRRRNI